MKWNLELLRELWKIEEEHTPITGSRLSWPKPLPRKSTTEGKPAANSTLKKKQPARAT